MNRDRDLRLERALEGWWDALLSGDPGAPSNDLSPDLAEFAQRVHALSDAPAIDPAFFRQLGAEIMGTQRLQLHPAIAPAGVALNGQGARTGMPRPRVVPRPAPFPPIRHAWTYAVSAGLIAAVLAMIFLVARSSQNGAIPPIQETATPPSASSTVGWPMFRGNPARTGSMPGPGPNGEPVVVWTYTAGSATRLAPAVANGSVYLIGDETGLDVLDAASGELLWHGGIDSSMPSVANGIVYGTVVDGTESLVAVDAATQEELWRSSPGNGFWTPLVTNEALYYGGDPHLLEALNPRTGDVLWLSAEMGVASRSVALADGVLVVGSDDGELHGIDQQTGRSLWNVPLTSGGTVQTPSILDGVAYAGAFGDASNAFVAVELQTGIEKWRFAGQSGEGFWAPGVAEGMVYVPTDGGRLYALDASSGAVVWTLESPEPMKAAPAIVDGTLYVGGDDGIVHALDARTGKEHWQLQTDGTITFGPVIADGMLYVSTGNGMLYAVGGSDDGAQPLDHPATPTAEATIATGPALAHFLWATSGSDQGRIINPLIIELSPDGRLWVGDGSGRFFIFDLDGDLQEIWGEEGSGDGQFRFDNPDFGGGLAFAADGSFYVADSYNQRIQHFDRDRQLIGSFGSKGSGDGQFLAPFDLALEPDGTIAVVDPYRNDVQRFAPDGTFISRFDGSATAGGVMQWPLVVEVAPDGGIWVVEYDGQKVRKFSPQGEQIGELDGAGSIPAGFGYPNDITLDADGFVYIADDYNDVVKVFDAAGHFIYSFGEPGSGDGQFNRAAGVAVKTGRAIYVIDWNNQRIQKFSIVGPWPAPLTGTIAGAASPVP